MASRYANSITINIQCMSKNHNNNNNNNDIHYHYKHNYNSTQSSRGGGRGAIVNRMMLNVFVTCSLYKHTHDLWMIYGYVG